MSLSNIQRHMRSLMADSVASAQDNEMGIMAV